MIVLLFANTFHQHNSYKNNESRNIKFENYCDERYNTEQYHETEYLSYSHGKRKSSQDWNSGKHESDVHDYLFSQKQIPPPPPLPVPPLSKNCQQYRYPLQKRHQRHVKDPDFISSKHDFNHEKPETRTKYHCHSYGPYSVYPPRMYTNPHPGYAESYEHMISSQSSNGSYIAYEYITEINDNDVLCGRGGATNVHIGNRRYRAIVKKHRDEYLSAKKKDKPVVASFIVQTIRNKSPPGRFLKKDIIRKAWYDIGDHKAREKTSQALREGAPYTRQSMGISLHSPDHPKEDISDIKNNCDVQENVSTPVNELNRSYNSDEQKRGPDAEDQDERESQSKDFVTREEPRSHSNRPTKRKIDSVVLDSLSPSDQKLYEEFDPPRAIFVAKPDRIFSA